jgi:hypothetical protein
MSQSLAFMFFTPSPDLTPANVVRIFRFRQQRQRQFTDWTNSPKE